MSEDDIYMRYSALKERHEKLKQWLFVICACTIPFALAFFVYPRTVIRDLGYCDTLRAAAHELRFAVITEKPEAVDTAHKALEELISECPEWPAE